MAIQPVQTTDTPNSGRTKWNGNDAELDTRVTNAQNKADAALVSVDGVSNPGGNVDLVPGANVTITPDDAMNTITIASSGGASGYATVQDEGAGLTQRGTLNFAGAGVTASDDAVAGKTTVNIPGGSGIASVDGVSNPGGNVDLVAGSNITITPDDTANTITIGASGGGGGYATVQEDGTALTQRTTLNFGSNIAAADNSVSGRTDVSVPDSSETTKGAVELATDAEAQSGTDTARAITPANLSARTATEARTGVVELATNAETTTGTDTTRAVHPAGVAAAITASKPDTSVLYDVDTRTANFTAAVSENYYLVSCTAGPVTATLPTAVGRLGKTYGFKKTDASTNALTIDPSGTETIDGASTISTPQQYDAVWIVSDGANWAATSPPLTGEPLATNTIAGVARANTTPASAADPVFVGPNDPLVLRRKLGPWAFKGSIPSTGNTVLADALSDFVQVASTITTFVLRAGTIPATGNGTLTVTFYRNGTSIGTVSLVSGTTYANNTNNATVSVAAVALDEIRAVITSPGTGFANVSATAFTG